jgi:hydrogenase expression/formation protein HypE
MNDNEIAPNCPVTLSGYTHITLAHGGGGKLMHQLIEDMILPLFDNPALAARHDGGVVEFPPGKLAATTDSYVVRPLIFPGSDIGALAVNGTLNDLAMCGARPLYLTLGLILEEGLPLSTLRTVLESIRAASRRANVAIVAGDTKVIERNRGDGMYINTAGIGVVEHDLTIAPARVRAGDAVILSGDIGRHGMAVMAVREGFAFESPIVSDCADLSAMVLQLIRSGVEVHCLRDLTRGGLGGALWEIARTATADIHVRESAIAVSEPVQGACEILGIDPLFVANEGRMIAILPEDQAENALAILRRFPEGAQATVIGAVREGGRGEVYLQTRLGPLRALTLPTSDPMPRIC